MTRLPSEVGIRRYADPRTKLALGWTAAVNRQDVYRSRRFQDAVYGGSGAARAAACEWRAAALAQLPKQPSRLANQTPRNDTRTGVTGVTRYVRGGTRAVYRAQLQVAYGPRFYKEFAVLAYGEQGALKRAVAERKRQLKQAQAWRAAHPVPPRSPAWRELNAPDMYGITRKAMAKGAVRITWGWAVAIVRNRRKFSKQFADSRFGGEAGALAAAKVWRDTIVRRHAPLSKRAYAQTVRRNNTSGVAGVSRREDEWGARWIARTTLPDGRRVQVSFPVGEHGEERAFKLAVVERTRQLEQVDGVLVHSPAAL